MQQYRESTVVLTSTPSVVVNYDPTRKVLILSNIVSATPCVVAQLPATLTGGSGTGLIVNSVLPIIMDVKTYGLAVVNGWYGKVSGASNTLYVGEVFDLDDPWPTPPGIAVQQNGSGGSHDPTSVAGVDRPDRVVDLTSELLRGNYAR